jgi:hypothetical protein
MTEEIKKDFGANGSEQAYAAYGARVANLMRDTIALSNDWTELRKQFTDDGFDGFQFIKSMEKAALLDAEDGKDRVEKLRAKHAFADAYLRLRAPEQQAEAAE